MLQEPGVWEKWALAAFGLIAVSTNAENCHSFLVSLTPALVLYTMNSLSNFASRFMQLEMGRSTWRKGDRNHLAPGCQLRHGVNMMHGQLALACLSQLTGIFNYRKLEGDVFFTATNPKICPGPSAHRTHAYKDDIVACRQTAHLHLHAERVKVGIRLIDVNCMHQLHRW